MILFLIPLRNQVRLINANAAMMNKRYLIRTTIVVLSFLLPVTMQAATSDSLLHQLKDLESPKTAYTAWFELNPAATAFVPVKELNSLHSVYRNAEASDNFYLVRDGNRTSSMDLQSESFQQGKKFSFFGKAAYGTEHKRNTGWNNVEDYSLVAPYVIADSVGGDYYRESYGLEGGFAYHRNGSDWGLRGAYQGSVSYRQVDPRPKNTVSVIRFNPGWMYTHSRFKAGVFAEYVRYRQNVDISIEKNDRKIFFYLLQGFGTYNRQFSFLGESMTRIYRGNTVSGGFHISQADRQRGVCFNLQQASVQVQESDRRIPYRLTHTIAALSATNDFIFSRKTLLLKADYLFSRSIGNETQYMPTVINTNFTVWTPVTASDRYQARRQQAVVSALLFHHRPVGFSWWQELTLGLNSERYFYYSPDYHQTIEDVTGAFKLGGDVSRGSSLFSVSVNGGYRKVLTSALNLQENNSIIQHQFLPDFRFLSTDRVFCGTELKYRFGVSSSLIAAVTASAGLQKQLAGDGKSLASGLTVSLIF